MVKDPPANAGDTDSNPRSGRSPGGGNGNWLQYSCLENAMDRGVYGAAKSRIPLGTQACTSGCNKLAIWLEISRITSLNLKPLICKMKYKLFLVGV